jgi:hypothetical protein
VTDSSCLIFFQFLFQGNLEGAQEAQVNAAGAHYKEIQRKIVEFLRKRYHILERCLDLEYAVVWYQAFFALNRYAPGLSWEHTLADLVVALGIC